MKYSAHIPTVAVVVPRRLPSFSLAISSDLRDTECQRQSQCQTPSGIKPPFAAHMDNDPDMDAGVEFEGLVTRYYRALYQFAFSLTRKEAEASDLTQETFYIWAKKGHQLRDTSKVKTWLFTTLHREFLKKRRRADRFPDVELEQAGDDMPVVSPSIVSQLDGATVVQALGRIEELYQAPVALFYLEEHSYKEIAEILGVPIGTVQSRIARGKAQLQKLLLDSASNSTARTQKANRG